MSRWKIKRRNKVDRKSRKPRARRRAPQILSIRGGMTGDTLETTITPVTMADMPALQRYFRAHELLPAGYLYDPQQDKYQRIVAMAVKLLEDPTARKTELTRAIVILGHSPTPSAIEALERMSEARHKLSKMARMALDECLGMAAELGPPDRRATGEMN